MHGAPGHASTSWSRPTATSTACWPPPTSSARSPATLDRRAGSARRPRPRRPAATAHRRRPAPPTAAARSRSATGSSSPTPRAGCTPSPCVAGKEFHTHKGALAARRADRRARGHVVTTTGGVTYLALRPLLADYVLSMPRGAAVVYPKDAGADRAHGRHLPGRPGGRGRRRLRRADHVAAARRRRRRAWCRRTSGAQDFAEIARDNVEAFFGGPHPAWRLTVGDLAESLRRRPSVDRVVLDMLAPWDCLDAVSAALVPGGVLICYVATTTQLSPHRRGDARARPLHRAAAPGSRWSAAGTSRGSPSAPSTGWSGTPASCSPPAGSPTGVRAAAAPPPPGQGRLRREAAEVLRRTRPGRGRTTSHRRSGEIGRRHATVQVPRDLPKVGSQRYGSCTGSARRGGDAVSSTDRPGSATVPDAVRRARTASRTRRSARCGTRSTRCAGGSPSRRATCARSRSGSPTCRPNLGRGHDPERAAGRDPARRPATRS